MECTIASDLFPQAVSLDHLDFFRDKGRAIMSRGICMIQ